MESSLRVAMENHMAGIKGRKAENIHVVAVLNECYQRDPMLLKGFNSCFVYLRACSKSRTKPCALSPKP